ncbi:uncharacterized protein BDR25DRAFT_351756 [Lindgomyces ingoldianus]|uniref:Uncharacterized protein n=1 Tax=Lindgomyces ingoldianus TaxID=673940 RepID=A0ACB6R4L0_9PLEO|nr:uncharacterized protein BDR25DRAFT_351756 [Lindgomyces ingoldianus]KAF2474228.1 hypothetical protein BDR25DRAFT_351756 [Lindgomyces ingoldianus]
MFVPFWLLTIGFCAAYKDILGDAASSTARFDDAIVSRTIKLAYHLRSLTESVKITLLYAGCCASFTHIIALNNSHGRQANLSVVCIAQILSSMGQCIKIIKVTSASQVLNVQYLRIPTSDVVFMMFETMQMGSRYLKLHVWFEIVASPGPKPRGDSSWREIRENKRIDFCYDKASLLSDPLLTFLALRHRPLRGSYEDLTRGNGETIASMTTLLDRLLLPSDAPYNSSPKIVAHTAR